MSKAIITVLDTDDEGIDIGIEYVDGRDDKSDAHFWAQSILEGLIMMIKAEKEGK